MFLTSTMQLGRVYDAACELLMAEDPGIGSDDVIIPIVAECDDSFLNDARRMQVTAGDVAGALAAARASSGRAGAGRGGGRRRDGNELPGLQGRDRDGVAADARPGTPSGCCCCPTSASAGG